MLADDGDKWRKVFGCASGIDMAPLAHGEIDSVEADFGSGTRQFRALKKLEVF